jgi:hypothetical protein
MSGLNLLKSVLPVLALALLSAVPFAPLAAEERKALPVDEAGQLEGLEAYRADLLDAIARRDVDAVVAGAADDIVLSFGGDAGRESLRQLLTQTEDDFADEYKHMADEEREGYWDALEDVLRLGGRVEGEDTFQAPYTWTVELGDNDDPYETYFVIGDAVSLRDRPNRHGTITATLSHDIVKAVDGGAGTRFRKVQLADGTEGYVHEDDLRSAVDYRAIFERRDGTWQMTMFLAGD